MLSSRLCYVNVFLREQKKDLNVYVSDPLLSRMRFQIDISDSMCIHIQINLGS